MAQRDEPLTRYCPTCQSKPGERCTRPDNTGRHAVRTFCLARATGPKTPPE